MEFIRSLNQLRPPHRGCVATIGNFDGVHRGHQAILEQVAYYAAQYRVPGTIIIFEPQPQEFFAPQQAPARLTRLREKLAAMHAYQVERVLCLRFNQAFAQLTAEAFIHRVLIQGLAVRHLVIGDDFRFGAHRQGDFRLLRLTGEQQGFGVESQQTFMLDGERVSSTRIRTALQAGHLSYAADLLGRPYRLSGRVRYGEQRGRSIGYPTANIFLHRQHSPLQGVFAVKLHGIAAAGLPGVANLGTRPTVNGQQLLLEVHIFDFEGWIYGRYVEVEFLHKLRSEQKFPSFAALKQQIELDDKAARELLGV